jgi:hypothetical protein
MARAGRLQRDGRRVRRRDEPERVLRAAATVFPRSRRRRELRRNFVAQSHHRRYVSWCMMPHCRTSCSWRLIH